VAIDLGNRCRLCGAAALSVGLRLPNSPANISRLPRHDELARDAPIDLDVYTCGACGFVQLTQALDDAYYDHYLMTVTHSPQMRAYQQSQARTFVSRHGLAGKRVIEVGCGDGHYLQCLADAGARGYGQEPSARFRALVEQRGFRCFGGYVTAQSPAPHGPYDAFATRQVLEHVPAPIDFLAGLRASIRPDGVGLIEVPSLEQTIEHGRFYDFFADHLNYFSEPTLHAACGRAGITVERVERGMHGEYLVAHVRHSPRSEPAAPPGAPAAGHALAPVRQALADVVDDLRRFVADAHAAGQRVAVWGAGGKGLTTLAVVGIHHVAYVVDSDPHKHGRLTPVTHLRIVPPENLRTDPVDALILTALAYRDEILRQLRGLGFAGRVAVLGRRLELL
jgi:SAM-dependent methyltransferase